MHQLKYLLFFDVFQFVPQATVMTASKMKVRPESIAEKAVVHVQVWFNLSVSNG